MTALSSDVTAALASLQTRWGEAAPRVGGGALAGSGTVSSAHSPRSRSRRTGQAPAPIPDDDGVIPTGFPALDAILGTGGIPRSAALAVRGARLERQDHPRPAARRRGTGGGLDRRLRGSRPQSRPGRGGRPRASASNGSSSSSRPRSRRRWRWPERSSPDVPSISSSSTCRPIERARRADDPAAGRDGRRLPSIADRLGRLAALARRSDVLLVVLEPPGLPAPVSSAIAESTGLRLELARRSWIRLGRDVVGQWTEVIVARNRAGPPGRRAELRILYAEGGGRDACLLREPLLTDAPTTVQSRIDHRATPPSPLAAPPPPAHPSARGRPGLRLLPDRSARPRRTDPGPTERSSTRTRRLVSSASGAEYPSDPPIDWPLRPRSSTRIPPRTRPRSSGRWRRSAAFSPVSPARPTPPTRRSGCSRSRSTGSTDCGDPSRSSSSGSSAALVRSFPGHPGSASPGRGSRRPPPPARRSCPASRGSWNRAARRPSSARSRPPCSPRTRMSGLGSPGSGCVGSMRSPRCLARHSSPGSAWKASGSTPGPTGRRSSRSVPIAPPSGSAWGWASNRRSRISSRCGSCSIGWPARSATSSWLGARQPVGSSCVSTLDPAFARRGTPTALAIEQRFPEPTAEG